MSLTQAEIDDGPQSGAALPSHWYVDDEVLEREFELIFERSWQCVGMTHELASSGDFITGQVGRIPVVVIRDQRGALRGYVNVCLHRCSLIAHGAGNADRLRCPYHAVQRGMRSGRVPRGYLMADTEHLVAHFGRLVAQALGDHEIPGASEEV